MVTMDIPTRVTRDALGIPSSVPVVAKCSSRGFPYRKPMWDSTEYFSHNNRMGTIIPFRIMLSIQ